jgi:hypothetical protein
VVQFKIKDPMFTTTVDGFMPANCTNLNYKKVDNNIQCTNEMKVEFNGDTTKDNIDFVNLCMEASRN